MLRNYNAQVVETYAMIKALNKFTGRGMPEYMVRPVFATRVQNNELIFANIFRVY